MHCGQSGGARNGHLASSLSSLLCFYYFKYVLTVNIAVEEMLIVLRHMKMEKSPRPDQIYPRTPWEAREEIVGTLAEIDLGLRV